jgi:predicted dehydrogenase
MAEKYRVALIGVGGMGIAYYHANCFVADERAELVACCDINREALDKFGDQFDIADRYEDADTMLASVSADVVVIGANETAHAPLTILAARHAPKAILCEKPMAMNLGEANAMIAACEETGAQLFIGHQRRYNTQYAIAKERLDAGAVGDLTQIIARGHPGSSLMVDGTHTVDLIRFYADDAPIEWVMAQVESTTGRVGWGHVLEDATLSTFKFQSGVRALLTTGGRTASAEESLGDAEGTNYHRITLLGSQGYIEIYGDGVLEGQPFVRVVSSHAGVEELPGGGWHNGLSPQSALLDTLEDGSPHLLRAESARATLEVLMAVYESAKLGQVIPLPLDNAENPLEEMLADA